MVKFEKKNIAEILLVIVAVFGIVYSFYNVLSQKILKSETRHEIQQLSDQFLGEQKQARRLKCVTKVFIEKDDDLIQDSSETVQILYDYEHERVQTVKGITKEIVEYGNESGWIYSKGITSVYKKDDRRKKEVSANKWYHYECDDIYREEKQKAFTNTCSYDYLYDIDNIISIKEAEQKENNGTISTKYIVTIQNTLREDLTEDMGDTGFRKLLNEKGVDATYIKNTYPDIYNMLKSIYNDDTEELFVWVDQDGIMRTLEKDYTFAYYLKMMKKNVALLEGFSKEYGYARVKSIQTYSYNQETELIELPQKFIEL